MLKDTRYAHMRVDGDGNKHRSEVLSKLPPFVAMSGGVDKAGPAAAPTDTAPLSDEEHGEEGRQESTADRGETAAEGTNGGLQAVVEQVLPAVNVEVTPEA